MKDSRAMETADRVVLEWARWTRSGADGIDATASSAPPSASAFGFSSSLNAQESEEARDTEEAEKEVWRNVRWVQQGERDHWFIYEGKDDPHNRDKRSNEIKTVLHVKDDVLTWIRRGAAEWRHQFEEGKQFTSILQTGPLVLDVMTNTHSLNVSVESDKGTITMDYSLDLSGEMQHVQTQIRFFKEGLYERQESLGGRG